MLKATVVNKIKFPKIALQEDLEYIAKNIIIPDMIRGIDNGAAIMGGQLPHNEPKTIKRKGQNRPLIETGTLRSSFIHRAIGKNKVIVSLASRRLKIGGYLQRGIMADGVLKQYVFFGISKDAFDMAIRYMKQKIKELTSGD